MIKTIWATIVLAGLPTILLAATALRARSADHSQSSMSELLNTNWSSDVRSSLGPHEATSAAIQPTFSPFARDIRAGTESDKVAALATIRAFSVDQSRSSMSELLNTNWSSDVRSSLGCDGKVSNDIRASHSDVSRSSGYSDREHN
jgi:hypothetical protein